MVASSCTASATRETVRLFEACALVSFTDSITRRSTNALIPVTRPRGRLRTAARKEKEEDRSHFAGLQQHLFRHASFVIRLVLANRALDPPR